MAPTIAGVVLLILRPMLYGQIRIHWDHLGSIHDTVSFFFSMEPQKPSASPSSRDHLDRIAPAPCETTQEGEGGQNDPRSCSAQNGVTGHSERLRSLAERLRAVTRAPAARSKGKKRRKKLPSLISLDLPTTRRSARARRASSEQSRFFRVCGGCVAEFGWRSLGSERVRGEKPFGVQPLCLSGVCCIHNLFQ